MPKDLISPWHFHYRFYHSTNSPHNKPSKTNIYWVLTDVRHWTIGFHAKWRWSSSFTAQQCPQQAHTALPTTDTELFHFSPCLPCGIYCGHIPHCLLPPCWWFHNPFSRVHFCALNQYYATHINPPSSPHIHKPPHTYTTHTHTWLKPGMLIMAVGRCVRLVTSFSQPNPCKPHGQSLDPCGILLRQEYWEW